MQTALCIKFEVYSHSAKLAYQQKSRLAMNQTPPYVGCSCIRGIVFFYCQLYQCIFHCQREYFIIPKELPGMSALKRSTPPPISGRRFAISCRIRASRPRTLHLIAPVPGIMAKDWKFRLRACAGSLVLQLLRSAGWLRQQRVQQASKDQYIPKVPEAPLFPPLRAIIPMAPPSPRQHSLPAPAPPNKVGIPHPPPGTSV